MLKSYEAIINNNNMVHWLNDKPYQPDASQVKVIITIMERQFQEDHKAESIEDLLERTEGIVNPQKSIEEIDADIVAMRDEWKRDWD